MPPRVCVWFYQFVSSGSGDDNYFHFDMLESQALFRTQITKQVLATSQMCSFLHGNNIFFKWVFFRLLSLSSIPMKKKRTTKATKKIESSRFQMENANEIKTSRMKFIRFISICLTFPNDFQMKSIFFSSHGNGIRTAF